MYKAHLLSYIEYRIPALYHACDTALGELDRVQTRFLREAGLTEEEALLEFNLAPLSARRDLAMLGLVHRTVLGRGPKQFRNFFKLAEAGGVRPNTRLESRRHHKQLQDLRTGKHTNLVKHSALGLTGVYNLLPTEAVELDTVKDFQGCLQDLLKHRAAAGTRNWVRTFSPREPLWCHPVLG